MQATGSHSQRNELLKTQDTLDLKEFWKTLVRRKRLVFGILLTTLLLTLLFTLLSTPVYRATTTVQIERESTKVFETDFLGPGDIRDPRGFYDTQFELIRSRSLMANVVKELNLDESAISPSLLGKIKKLVESKGNNQNTSLIDNLLDNITVEPVRNSRLVAINVDTPSADLSAKIANSIATNFVSSNQTSRSSLTNDAKSTLQKRIDDAKTKLEASEYQLNEYSRLNGILGTDDNNYESQSTTLSLIVTKLSEQIVQAESKRIGLETSGKASASEVEAARNNVNLLREELSVRQGELLQQQTKMIEYKTLQRAVKNNQEVYQTLLKRIEEIDMAGSMAANNLSIIDRAEVPAYRHKPNLTTNLAFAFILGSLLGIAAAFLKEFMYDGIKNVSDLEHVTNLPILAAIPAAKQGVNANKIARFVASDPSSSIAEAFRSLRTTLRFSTVENQQQSHIIYITSSCANEGKTTTSSNLALAYANAGVKVLLIDADLRNPSFAEALGVNSKTGLADYLQGKIALEQLVHSTSTPRLHIITAGATPQDPVELLSSKRLKNLLDQAKQIFEVIILDGPPVLGLADSLLLSSLADSTLLTVNSRDTKITAIQNSIKRLRQANGNLIGIVLNKIDTSGRLGYDYDYYYYKDKKATA